MRTLRFGDVGPDVGELQRLLALFPDKSFGRKTETAVKTFQTAHGLTSDGVCGRATWEALTTPPDVTSEIPTASLLAISRLHLTIQEPAVSFIRDALHAAGMHLAITQGFRSLVEQAALYSKGRTTPGPIVTDAPPGSSWHNFGLAFDVALIVNGKATWPNDDLLWTRIGLMGEAHGLEWGGRWKDVPGHSIKDRPHFQRTGGLSLAQARMGMRPED